MEIYSTLTRSKETFETMNDNRINLFVCGPTVYDDAHIGHGRTYISFDTIKRYWEYKGYTVFYIQNITDVDDKIIKRSKETGIPAGDIARKFEKRYIEDMNKLNVTGVNLFARSTDHMGEIIDQIQRLIDKGFAYETEDGVYFGIDNFEEFGKLSNRNIEELESHREIAKTTKKNPIDFALWKKRENVDEPVWNSPWGEGRPGWHIECSVMSKKYLGDEIDIHAGGEDLIFPHHENEIAQSEAANGCEFSKYWMHNGFLNINNKKMSKSLGNFFTVRDISEKYNLQVLRFFMLSAHYRSPLNFSDDLMESAKNGLERIITSGAKIRDIISNGKDGKVTDAEAKLLDEAKEYITKFEEAMDDDCNTANAISAVFELVKFANSNLNEGSTKEFAAGVYEILDKLCNVLGIILEKEEEKVGDEDYIEEMIAKRAQAKKDRDFAMADQIRDELAAKGIVLKDTREGTKWSRA